MDTMARYVRSPVLLAGVLALLLAALEGCSSTGSVTSPSPSSSSTPATGVYAPVTGDINTAFAMLTHTIDYSSLDHSPVEGAWNYPLEDAGFQAIADAGFTAVRLPVRFSAHMLNTPPYTIDETFLERVDWAVNEALSHGLAVIIDNHHWGVEGAADFDTIFTDPASQNARLEAIWQQVAPRYADDPEGVIFELLNEPHGNLDAVWNDYQDDLLGIVRQSNPDRAVVVSGPWWSGPFALNDLALPDDPNLIVTFHDYIPMDFTHQGATWVNPVPPVGVSWPMPTLRFTPSWSDWSWGMTHTLTTDGLEVQATEDWAGIYLHSESGVAGASSIQVTLANDAELWVDCRTGEEGTQHTADVHAKAGVPLTITTAECGLASPVFRDIRMMVGTHPDAHFSVTDLAVTGPTGTAHLFVTPQEELAAGLEAAATWSAAHGNVPMFLGEFGASNLADQASRERWVRAVQTGAAARGIATGYWEFQGDWGFWTPQGGVTEPWLRDAILGK